MTVPLRDAIDASSERLPEGEGLAEGRPGLGFGGGCQRGRV